MQETMKQWRALTLPAAHPLNIWIERYQAALEQIAAGAAANAGRCQDCESMGQIASAALTGAMSVPD